VAGRSAFLLLDGVFAVEVDGETVVEIGPGAIVGERALLEGERTATLRAVTPAKVVEIPEGELSRAEATAIATGHRREQG
jgi:CRP-like cAMP-binding protein